MSESEAAEQPNKPIVLSATELGRLSDRIAQAAVNPELWEKLSGADRDIAARVLRHLVWIGWLRATVSLAPLKSDQPDHPTVSHRVTD